MASTGCCSGGNDAAGGGTGTSGDARGSGDVEIGVAVAESKNVAVNSSGRKGGQHHQKKSSNNPFGRG